MAQLDPRTRTAPTATRKRSRVQLAMAFVGLIVALVGTLLVACSDGGNPAQLGGGPTADSGPGNPCATPNEGCSCNGEGLTVQCGEVKIQSGNYVTCSQGTRTCTAGKWGACVGDHTVFKSIGSTPGIHTLGLTQPSSCNDPCDPSCISQTGNANNDDAGPGLTNIDGGWELTADGGIGLPHCTGPICSKVPTCPVGTTTTISGTVYDPAGLNPIYQALVYIPANANLSPWPKSGVAADPCSGNRQTPAVVSWALTGPDGKFTLTGAAAGSNVPIVVQKGYWRREIFVTIPACTQTALTVANTRLPKNHTEGDMPFIGLASGACDPMECLLSRIGVDSSEFTSPGGGGQIEYYVTNGFPLNGGTNPFVDQLIGSSSTLNNYNIVMLPCACGDEYSNWWYSFPSSYHQNLVQWTGNGGRLFTSHWGREWIEGGNGWVTPPYPNVATWEFWNPPYGGSSDPVTGYVDTSFTLGADFSSWLTAAGVAGGNFQITPSKFDVSAVNPTYSTRMVYGWSDNTGPGGHGGVPDSIFDFTFDTPISAPKPNKYGRVMYTDMHLAVPSSNFWPNYFPNECKTGALSAQEKAAEFLFFDLGACKVVTPPPIVYQPATFSQQFLATCGPAQKAVWHLFSWEDSIPTPPAGVTSANLVFTAQTSSTLAGLTAAPLAPLATVTQSYPTWTGVDVDSALVAQGQVSLSYLQVNMTLNPSGDGLQTPILIAWQQAYSCIDSE